MRGAPPAHSHAQQNGARGTNCCCCCTRGTVVHVVRIVGLEWLSDVVWVSSTAPRADAGLTNMATKHTALGTTTMCACMHAWLRSHSRSQLVGAQDHYFGKIACACLYTKYTTVYSTW